jgi:thiamine-phosphate pyrophosphorylase
VPAADFAMPHITPRDQLAALRIVDANLNRASEGLRVVEEHCRFALADRHLTECCKQLRHDLMAAAGEFDVYQLYAARETQADVGTSLATASEFTRDSLSHIAAANWQRVQESLRAIEEYAKLLAPAIAARVEALRYRAYTLAKACTSTADGQRRLAGARLYVLIDGSSSECAFAGRAEDLITAGVHVLQLRDKQLDGRTLLARARLLRRIIDERRAPARQEPRPPDSELRNATEGVPYSADSRPPTPDPRPAIFILNDRPDLAVLARADGVHVGQDELSVHDVRQIVGPDLLVGVSTHSIEQARQAVLDGASYLGCGPTFPSGTKHFDSFPGLEFLRQVAAEIALPAFAIGGITAENLPQVLATGIARVAVGGAIAKAKDRTSIVHEFASFLAANQQVAN